jgi:hypothetical protein
MVVGFTAIGICSLHLINVCIKKNGNPLFVYRNQLFSEVSDGIVYTCTLLFTPFAHVIV